MATWIVKEEVTTCFPPLYSLFPELSLNKDIQAVLVDSFMQTNKINKSLWGNVDN